MTEAEWLACSEPERMLEYLRKEASDRKLRLFSVSCCRRIGHLLAHEESRRAVEEGERHADGLTSLEVIRATWEAADMAAWAFGGVLSEQMALIAVEWATKNLAAGGCARACRGALEASEQERAWLPWERRTAPWRSEMRARIERTVAEEMRYQADLLRCILGNPFGPVTPDSARLTPDVESLAQTIYDERVFDRMPELAGALEGSGCDVPDILDHCRSPGPHAKGCWVIDLVLGKS